MKWYYLAGFVKNIHKKKNMRRGLGIVGLLIGLSFALVLWFFPIDRGGTTRLVGDDFFREATFLVLIGLWILFSFSVKVTMALNIRLKYLGYIPILLFIAFITLGSHLPHGDTFVEIHPLQDNFGLIWFFGWSVIDTADLAMTHLRKKW